LTAFGHLKSCGADTMSVSQYLHIKKTQ